MKEEALLLGPHRSIVGVYTPAVFSDLKQTADCAVVLLNAGLVHHAGPHRLHVTLARALARQGISALRVDFSGIGDSPVRPDNLPAQELAVQEIREILDELVRRGHGSFVLFGICSGARYALQATPGDPRIKGLVVVNAAPAARDPEQSSQAAAQYYLRRSFWNPRAWFNLFTGRVKYKLLFQSLLGMVWRMRIGGSRNKSSLTEVARKGLAPFLAQGTRLFVLLSDRDARAFELVGDGLRDLQQSGQLKIAVYPEADHLFTSLEEQKILVEEVCRWVVHLHDTPVDADDKIHVDALVAD